MILEFGMPVDNPSELKNNTIIGIPAFLDNSTVQFQGKNNILVVEENVRLSDSSIRFCGDDALIVLSQSKKHAYKIRIDAWQGTTVFFGSDNYFNGSLHAIVSERQNLIVGSKGVFSFGIWIRTADPHIIYDSNTKKRINLSRSVMIGDHVWLGQNCLLLKGTTIGSGSIISANCVMAGKKVESNAVYAGNPGRKLKSGIFFSGKSVHNYTKLQTEESMQMNSDRWVFNKDKSSLNIEKLFQQLTDSSNSKERLEIVKKVLRNNNQRNRLAIETPQMTFKEKLKQLFRS